MAISCLFQNDKKITLKPWVKACLPSPWWITISENRSFMSNAISCGMSLFWNDGSDAFSRLCVTKTNVDVPLYPFISKLHPVLCRTVCGPEVCSWIKEEHPLNQLQHQDKMHAVKRNEACIHYISYLTPWCDKRRLYGSCTTEAGSCSRTRCLMTNCQLVYQLSLTRIRSENLNCFSSRKSRRAPRTQMFHRGTIRSWFGRSNCHVALATNIFLCSKGNLFQEWLQLQ